MEFFLKDDTDGPPFLVTRTHPILTEFSSRLHGSWKLDDIYSKTKREREGEGERHTLEYTTSTQMQKLFGRDSFFRPQVGFVYGV